MNLKTYRFKGYTLYLRGHNLLFCRVWGYRPDLGFSVSV